MEETKLQNEETTFATATNETAQEPNQKPTGAIKEVGCLDLRHAKTPEDLSGISSITEVGCILIPPYLAPALMRIHMENVGVIIPVPEGENIKLRIGQTYLTGEALASGGAEDTLYVIGQLFITSPVTSVGYKEISVHGQMFAIRGSENALGSKLGSVQGQTFYLPAGARTLMGDESLGLEFLDLLPAPTAFVVMGTLTIEDDVTLELLKSKVTEFVLMGQIRVPKTLHALVQVLTVEKMGEIVVK